MLTREQKIKAKHLGVAWASDRRLNSPDDNGQFDPVWVHTGDMDVSVEDRASFAGLVAASAARAWENAKGNDRSRTSTSARRLGSDLFSMRGARAMKRPAKGDRYQNRRTSRVCVVEEIRGGPDAAHTTIWYRYQDSRISGRRPRQWTSLPYFHVAFTEYEPGAGA